MAHQPPATLVRETAGVLDLSHRARIVVRGADRKTFLHALLTNDIASLAGGTGCHALLLTPQGRLVADLRVFELGDLMLIDVDRAAQDTFLAKLDQLLFGEDVQLGDVTDAWGAIGVYGPRAASIVGGVIREADSAGAEAIAGLAPFHNVRVNWRDEATVVARADGLGLQGYLLFASMVAIQALGESCMKAGASYLEPETVELLRIEAGEPAFQVDVTEDTIPLEADFEASAVSFSKGCFPGQEVLVRIRDRGHGRVARKLVGLALEGPEVPARGSVVRAGDKDVGVVTSAVFSPARNAAIALGFVQRDQAEPGRAVTIAHGQATLQAAVSALPFPACGPAI